MSTLFLIIQFKGREGKGGFRFNVEGREGFARVTANRGFPVHIGLVFVRRRRRRRKKEKATMFR